MHLFRDSRSSDRRRALRAVGIVMLVLVSAMAITMSPAAEQDDDVTPPQFIAQLAPLRVVSTVFTAPPPPPLSAPVTPEYQPPRFA